MKGILRSIVAIVLAVVSCFALASPEDDDLAQCRVLATADFAATQDAPTQVTEAKWVEATGEQPAHCSVQGYVWPQIRFAMKLPVGAQWNRKFFHAGMGGIGGGPLLLGLCDDPLRRGYACITSDKGPTGGGLGSYNDLQSQVDLGIRSGHVVTLAGKAITQRNYEERPRYSYYWGCSGGGLQAMVEAQYFPWDFDGIIASDFEGGKRHFFRAAIAWNELAIYDSDGTPLFSADDLDLLHQAALARCDLDDGVKDGVIGNPPACDVDPGVLACKRGQTVGCLSDKQIAAARKVYSGPVTSSGERWQPGRTMPGAEKNSALGFQVARDFGTDYFRYMAFNPDPGPTWQLEDLDFDVDYKRMGVMSALQVGNLSPDLRRFKAAGGKLIITQSWTDSGAPTALNTVDYYEMVERIMGGRRATQEFTRLFMMPGREHCGGGPGANAFDMISSLEAWVERGEAPDMMIGAHESSSGVPYYHQYGRMPEAADIKFTRPVYPYPLRAVYQGTGDPNDWRNWKSVEAPVQWDELN
jgi:feruloyl esterase